MSYDLWSEASRDHDAEAAVRRLATAKVAAAPLWTFLANAQSMEEFDYRLDMASERLASIAEGDTLDALLASLREDFRVLSSVEDEAAAESNEDPEGGLDSRVTSSKVAYNDAEVSQASSEMHNGYGVDRSQPHLQNCTRCGTHFDGNGPEINFTPGPGNTEWNHCPSCMASAEHGEVQDCSPTCHRERDHTDHRYDDGGEYDDYDDGYDDDQPDYHGLDGDNYGDPYGKMDRYHDMRQYSRIALLKVTAGGEEAFVLVDEKSGYKVGGPFKSRAEAAQALNGPKFKGRHVSIEKRGGEDEEKEKGGKGNHDEAGGSKPFETKERRGHEGSKTAGDVSPFDANGPEQTPHDGPEIGQVTDTFNIPQTTKPRQMPSGGGGMGDMGGGVDMLNDSDGMSSPGGMQEGGAANREDGGSNQMNAVASREHTAEELQFLAALVQRNADFNPLNYGMSPPEADGPLTDLVKRKVDNVTENGPGLKAPTQLLPGENAPKGGSGGAGAAGDLAGEAAEAAEVAAVL